MIVNYNAKQLIQLLSKNDVPFDMEIYDGFEGEFELQIFCPSLIEPLTDAILDGDFVEVYDREKDEVFRELTGDGAFYKMWETWDKHRNE